MLGQQLLLLLHMRLTTISESFDAFAKLVMSGRAGSPPRENVGVGRTERRPRPGRCTDGKAALDAGRRSQRCGGNSPRGAAAGKGGAYVPGKRPDDWTVDRLETMAKMAATMSAHLAQVVRSM